MKTFIYSLLIASLCFCYSCQSDDLFNEDPFLKEKLSEEMTNQEDYEEIVLERTEAEAYLRTLGLDDDILDLLLQDQNTMTRYATGQYGGQCLVFVQNYFKYRPTVPYAKQLYYSSFVNRLGDKVASKTIACWGTGTYGHVGVVHDYNPNTKKMTFIDSNYRWDERIIVRKNLTVSAMKRLTGNFQGFAKFKK